MRAVIQLSSSIKLLRRSFSLSSKEMQSFFFLGLLVAVSVPPPLPPLLLVLLVHPKLEVAYDSDALGLQLIWDLSWSRPNLVQDRIRLIVDGTWVKNTLQRALHTPIFLMQGESKHILMNYSQIPWRNWGSATRCSACFWTHSKPLQFQL